MTDEQQRPGERNGELKPCPFCGGEVTLEQTTATYSREHGNRAWWGVCCRNTRNIGGTCAVQIVPSASREAAVSRWNMRAPVSEKLALPSTAVIAPRSLLRQAAYGLSKGELRQELFDLADSKPPSARPDSELRPSPQTGAPK